LSAGGGTAIYDSLQQAYELAISQQQERPGTFVSIVLMTDGQNNAGAVATDFQQYYSGLGSSASSIPTFVVLFGDGNVAELTDIAKLTGGQVFDARDSAGLAGAFQQIRGYQ
jgi:Ca-activated chloride channel family protein